MYVYVHIYISLHKKMVIVVLYIGAPSPQKNEYKAYQ